MTGALIILIFTALVGLVLYIFDRRRHPLAEAPAEPAELPAEQEPQSECCGMHLVCEKDSLLVTSPNIEYFDDEELDAFAGRSADSYTESEAALFTDILLTMRPEETPAWARSLQLRGIELPPSVRDELFMIVSEQRAARRKNR